MFGVSCKTQPSRSRNDHQFVHESTASRLRMEGIGFMGQPADSSTQAPHRQGPPVAAIGADVWDFRLHW